MSEQLVYLNGDFVSAKDASISVFDRGFLFGDSVYEVMPVYNGLLQFFERHMARLKSSLCNIKMDMPSLDWLKLFQTLIEKNGGGDLQIYLQITRGNQGLRKHDFSSTLKPTIVAFTLHIPYPTIEEKQHGIHAKTVNDIRWKRCDIKTTSLLANVLINHEALSDGAQTSILIRDGLVTEGGASNIFIVDKLGVISTPPKSHHCLAGVTRDVVLDLLRELKWPCQEINFELQTLMNAQEVWMTSTTKEIFPITLVNNVPIGNGTAGVFWQQIDQVFQQRVR